MLDQLLEAEQRATERLAIADAEASRLVEEARTTAAADDKRAAIDLDAELERMRRSEETERTKAIEAIKRDAAARVAQYDRADAEAIGRRLVALILSGSRDADVR